MITISDAARAAYAALVRELDKGTNEARICAIANAINALANVANVDHKFSSDEKYGSNGFSITLENEQT